MPFFWQMVIKNSVFKFGALHFQTKFRIYDDDHLRLLKEQNPVINGICKNTNWQGLIMARIVYLLRNGDLYKIGHSKDMQQVLKRLKPDEILQTVETDDPFGIEARLLRKYKTFRIPETEYFRLNKDQVDECIKQMNVEETPPISLTEEVSIGLKGAIVLGLVGFFVCLLSRVGPARGTSIGFALASLPMWMLFVTGSFGGYDAEDVPFFSTWSNRMKGIILALSFTCISFTFESLNRFIGE